MKKPILSVLALVVFAASAQPIAPNTPLVTSGPIVVTAQDFEAQMLRIPESARGESRASLERVASMTDSVFVNRSLAAEARAAGFLDSPLLKLRGEQVLEAFQARSWLDEVEKKRIHVNLEARAREVYLADRKRYTQPGTFEVEHILVNLWGRTREMALERVNEARAKIAAGADFNAIAKEYSNDPTVKMNSGKLGTTQASQLDSEIGQALPKLKDGEVSQPILARSGYHLVRVTQRTAGRQIPFEEVKEVIMEEERAKANRRFVDEHLQSFRAKAKIDSEALKKLVVELPRQEIDAVYRENAKANAPKAAPKAP
jgi:parvulin-like peptidyl-prolyl isomerase